MDTELHLLGRLAPAQGIEDAAQRWRLMVDAVDEYAIFLLAPDGTVMSWNPGAQRLEGYTASEILGDISQCSTRSKTLWPASRRGGSSRQRAWAASPMTGGGSARMARGSGRTS